MARGLLALALIGIAATVGGCQHGYSGPSSGYGTGHHVRWCLAHHPDYNLNTNLFHDRFGALRACEHP